MKDKVTKACLKFLNEGGDLGTLNHTLLALVPKVKEPTKVIDFRPISLYMVLNKIIAKTIAIRPKSYLSLVIS